MALIRCPECGREVSDKAHACPHCGMPVSEMKPKPQFCHNCGATLVPGSMFCTECGTKVISVAEQPKPFVAPPAAPKPAPAPTQQWSQPAPQPATPTPAPPPMPNVVPAQQPAESVTSPKPATQPVEPKVEIPKNIQPKKAPDMGLTGKAEKRRAEAMARRENQRAATEPQPKANDKFDLNKHDAAAPEPETPSVDMPELVKPKSAPTAKSGKNKNRQPAEKPATKPAPTKPAAVKTEIPKPKPASAPTPKPEPKHDVKQAEDETAFYEPYDDNYQSFESQISEQRAKQRKTLMMVIIGIVTLAVIGLCIWLFASVGGDEEAEEIVNTTSISSLPEWMQGEWNCKGETTLNGEKITADCKLNIDGSEFSLTNFKGKDLKGTVHIEGNQLICVADDGEQVSLDFSEQYQAITYAGDLKFSKGGAAAESTAAENTAAKEVKKESVKEEPATTTKDDKATKASKKSATKTEKVKTTKHKASKQNEPAPKAPKANNNNSYSSKKRSSSLPDF